MSDENETWDRRERWQPAPRPEWVARLNEEGELLTRRLKDVRNLEVPTLLIRGRLSDLVSEQTAAEFLEMVPHAEYVNLADAHHMVAGDRNDVFTDTVAEFLLRRFPTEDTTAKERVQRTPQ